VISLVSKFAFSNATCTAYAPALVDLAMELRAYGGIYGGNNKATDFLCLTLKMVGLTNIC
jgi:hypothetical protein